MKHWSSTQTSVSLSSGEAEFNGVVRGAGQGLGYQSLLRDFGIRVPLRVWTDSSAAIGICSRQGLGKLRHLDTHTLWIQQAVRSGRVDLKKVAGAQNLADLLTKHSLSREKLVELTSLYSCKYLDGRAASAPKVREGLSGKTLVAEADDINALAINRIDSGNVHGIPTSADTAWMPHCALDLEQLNADFPSLVAPMEENLEDLLDDRCDLVYQHGIGIAQRIADDMAMKGRTRQDIED